MEHPWCYVAKDRESALAVFRCFWSMCTCLPSRFSRVWLCNCLQGSSVHGISQARIPEWVAMHSSKGSSRPRDRTCFSCNSLLTEPLGEAPSILIWWRPKLWATMPGAGTSDKGEPCKCLGGEGCVWLCLHGHVHTVLIQFMVYRCFQ